MLSMQPLINITGFTVYFYQDANFNELGAMWESIFEPLVLNDLLMIRIFVRYSCNLLVIDHVFFPKEKSAHMTWTLPT